jgi:hypothetical protein
MSNDIIVSDQRNLAVELTSSAVSALSTQRIQLKEFIQNQLVKDVDYGIIPGTPKPTLYKPGAEKLANIFQLGSRICDVQKEISFEPPQFAMFTYTIEMFHLPSGKIISQCQGSANSEEKKYKKVGIGDLLNTLQKMAQKRAYVGAVVIATGASDFFTQDVEDLPAEMISNETGELTDRYIVQYGRCKGKPLFECDRASLKGYVDWARDKTAPKMKADAEVVEAYLKNPEIFEKHAG